MLYFDLAAMGNENDPTVTNADGSYYTVGNDDGPNPYRGNFDGNSKIWKLAIKCKMPKM